MKTIQLIITGVLLVTLVSACKKGGEVLPPDATTTPVSTGSVVGFVRLREGNGTLITNAQNVIVTVTGTSITTVTSAEGKYVLSEIPVGTYNLKFAKAGYDYAVQQVYITGNGTATIMPLDLIELPTAEIATVTYTGYDSLGYNFTVTLHPKSPQTAANIIVPYSTTLGVNITDDKKKIKYVDELKFLNTSFTSLTTKITLPRSFFRPKYPNAFIYVKFFVSNSKASVLDSNTGLFYYSNYSAPSGEFSFQVL